MNARELQQLNESGEEGVLLQLAEGHHGEPGSSGRAEVDAWLALKAFNRNLALSASMEARASEQIRIERELLQTAKQQKTVAIVAMMLSAVTAIIATFIGAILAQAN